MFRLLLFCAVVALCCVIPTHAENEVAIAPITSLWSRVAESIKPQSLTKIVKSLPRTLSRLLTWTLELVISTGKKVVQYFDSTEFSISARMIQESIIGRLLKWDFIGTGLRLMKVRSGCHAKAACECGGYVLKRSGRIALFLTALRSHFQASSAHWPAMMAGLQGENCETLYEECRQNFLMSW